jgi:protein-S-isoprenylcysteine O-methyltransferase Ste14
MSYQNTAVAAAPTPQHRKTVPAWAAKCYQGAEHLLFDLGGGPRILQLGTAINIQKFITVFAVYAMMVYHNNYSLGAWVYLGLHGVYGYTWLIKDLAFPNQAFEKRITIGGLLMLHAGLNFFYWGLAWVFMSRHVEPSGPLLFAAIFIHTLGVAWMAASDLQKNCMIRYRKGLISNGVFTYTRNPNYLGETMIYGSYAMLTMHWFGALVILLQFFLLFLPRMLVKDASISRYPGWEEYERRSGLIIPWALLNGKALFARAGDAEPEASPN